MSRRPLSNEARLDIYPDGGLARLRLFGELRVSDYPRDMVGYGRTRRTRSGPAAPRIAVQFVLNYEEGAENYVLDGDPSSETFLSEMHPGRAVPQSAHEHGVALRVRLAGRIVARAEDFRTTRIPLTIFAVARAMQRNPEAVARFRELGHEIACHGLRWKSYQLIDRDTERAHMAEAVQILRDLTGAAPLGWYTGRDSPHTRRPGRRARRLRLRLRLLRRRPAVLGAGARHGDHLVVPYTLDTNDMRFASPAGFANGDEFFAHLRDAFDVLYAEAARQPEDAVGRPALPPGGRPARTGRWSGSSTTCRPTTGVDRTADRDRRALAALLTRRTRSPSAAVRRTRHASTSPDPWRPATARSVSRR